ncbi:PKD domain-containing protein [Halobacterium salinarum]|uniref:PKD domain-containing protein n=1 Tax=Halobacterium salinarum TaxID=2242 RepID=UPI0025562648|nr:PKD domain-containing protein [Halobacterium salinarum]MDL0124726.1 PKD domain-containing protein [Halobacterium salinarum]
MTTGTDDVDGKVELAPAGGPNGEYAVIEDGELRIDFGSLNDRATTTVDDVVTITASTDEPVKVWVTTELSGRAHAYTGTDPEAELGQANPRTLQPGDSLSVGFVVDTHNEGPDTGTLTVTVGDPDEETTDDPDDDPTGTETPEDTEPTENDTETDIDEGDVEVTFDGGDIGDGESVNMTTLDSLPADGQPGDPEAIIEPASILSQNDDDVLAIRDSAFVVAEGESVTLTGTRSYIRTANAITSDPKPAAIVSITPPRELRDQPATVRIRVARDKFTETDPTEARIGRQTPEGWQLLPTQVVQMSTDTVLLEARTYGFSVFTVFPESQVTYQWTLPNGTTVAGDDLRTVFEEPGRYNVTLTVTDADGRSNQARQQILVNDDPSVSIKGATNATPGEQTTLRANVTNEIGNATVTWTLPSGETVVGETVTREFESGATVRVAVEDEFGATGEAEATIGAGASSGNGVVATVQDVVSPVPAWAAVTLAVIAVALAALLIRSQLVQEAVARIYRGVKLLRDAFAADTPRVVTVGTPTWNPDRDCIDIDELRVESPGGLLDTVEITVTGEDGEVIVRKQIEVGTASTYTATPERISVYGGVDLPAEGGYEIQIRAVDDRNHVGTSQPIQAARPLSS